MKYLSTFLILAAMYWTWGLIRHDRPISEQIHVSIQEDLKQLISELIQKNLPNSTNLRFDRFWTETVDENKVKATFTYSFDDTSNETGTARTQIEGYTVLKRTTENADSVEWSFDEPIILNNEIEFKEPMKISPQDSAPSGG